MSTQNFPSRMVSEPLVESNPESVFVRNQLHTASHCDTREQVPTLAKKRKTQGLRPRRGIRKRAINKSNWMKPLGIRIDRDLDEALERGVEESKAQDPVSAPNKNTHIRIAIREYLIRKGWYVPETSTKT